MCGHLCMKILLLTCILGYVTLTLSAPVGKDKKEKKGNTDSGETLPAGDAQEGGNPGVGNSGGGGNPGVGNSEGVGNSQGRGVGNGQGGGRGQSAARKEKLKNKSVQVTYLVQFGYLDDAKKDDDEEFKKAVKGYQNKWHLSETGEVDEETLDLMSHARCGRPDNEKGTGRVKRYDADVPWSTTSLSYGVTQYSSNSGLTIAQIDTAMDRGVEEWAKHAPLTFTKDTSSPDIEIIFASGSHGDGYAFDGDSGVLAHAFYPRNTGSIAGDAHFDDDEYWTLYEPNNYDSIDIFQVGVHEFGHSLGLGHTNFPSSVMNPYYDYLNPWQFSSDDIAGIQALYGAVTEPPATPSTGLCSDPSVDAMARDNVGVNHVFKGSDYYQVSDDGSLAGNYPVLISDVWPRLPSSGIDAVVSLPSLYRARCRTNKRGKTRCRRLRLVESTRTYVFAGNNYYEYRGSSFGPNSYYATGAIATGFPGVPNDVDTAFTTDGTEIHFIKGDTLYTHRRDDNSVTSKTTASDYPDLPATIDAAMTLYTTSTNYTYFFSGTEYYRVADAPGAVDTESPAYPRDIGEYWFGCSGSATLSDIMTGVLSGVDQVLIDQNEKLVREYEEDEVL